MGLRDFLKKAEKDDEESGWHVGSDEDDEGINVTGAIGALKELNKMRKKRTIKPFPRL